MMRMVMRMVNWSSPTISFEYTYYPSQQEDQLDMCLFALMLTVFRSSSYFSHALCRSLSLINRLFRVKMHPQSTIFRYVPLNSV